jgi:acyl-CoA thioester hydrolase
MEEQDGVLLAVAEASCRYASPARYDEEVTIKTWIEEPHHRMVTFQYEMRVGDRRIATGHTRHIFLNRELRPARMPQKYVEMFR